MTTNPQNFLQFAIRPALKELGLCSPAAVQLLLATAIHESHLKHRKQIAGPALSYFQIEPKTHDDIWNNFLKYRPQLASKITHLMSNPKADKLKELENNDEYAAAIARIKYYRANAPLPPLNNIPAMAHYWKRYYNTRLGRGSEKSFITDWEIFNKKWKMYNRTTES